eukprot:scaffold2_cov94-Skeletonema_dohrnii-CCMP3373.AAC.5
MPLTISLQLQQDRSAQGLTLSQETQYAASEFTYVRVMITETPASPAGAVLLDRRDKKTDTDRLKIIQNKTTCYCKTPGREGGRKRLSTIQGTRKEEHDDDASLP